MTDDTMKWSEQAETNLKKVPEFARAMAREMIEDFARSQGANEITPEIMKLARAKFGM